MGLCYFINHVNAFFQFHDIIIDNGTSGCTKCKYCIDCDSLHYFYDSGGEHRTTFCSRVVSVKTLLFIFDWLNCASFFINSYVKNVCFIDNIPFWCQLTSTPVSVWHDKLSYNEFLKIECFALIMARKSKHYTIPLHPEG